MNLFNFIKNNVSILEVVNEYATLKKAGLYFKGICPFHHEKTPSFTVSPHRNIFYCFGCHSGGDVIAFIEKAEKCSAFEAAQFLAERFQLEIPEHLKNYHEQPEVKQDEKKRYHELLKLISNWTHEKLIKSPAVLRYLTDRGIHLETIKKCTIGYFPGGLASIKSLIERINKEHFLVDDLLKAHIIAQGKSVLYSPFEDRILFPIKDHLGRHCGFGGRVFKKDDDRSKYYNSRENEYFVKGTLLFGLDLAKPSIQEKSAAFLVEGYTDCLAMIQHGYQNTIATLGTACTFEHLKTLSRYAQEIFVLYDADKAGKDAVLRLTELCWQTDLELKIIELPSNEDPASFLAQGKDLKPLIANAQDIFTIFIESTAQNFMHQGLQEKVATIRSLLGVINSIGDNLKQEILLGKAAKSFDMPLSSLKRELAALKNRKNPENKAHQKVIDQEQRSTPTLLLKEIPLLEKKLFSVIINNVQMLLSEDQEYLQEYLSQPLQRLLKKLLKIKGDTPQVDFAHFFEALQDEEKLLVSHLILECQEYEGSENFEYLLSEFQKKTWKSFVADTKIKLDHAQQQNNQKAVQDLVQNFQI
jgi:DNA primase